MFVIFLREGIEAFTVVAILLGFLKKIGADSLKRYVIAGVFSAIGLILAFSYIVYKTVSNYDGSTFQTVFESITFAVAVIFLIYMTFWMKRHSKTIAGELREKASNAVNKKEKAALFGLSFQAVGREGLETAIFSLAILFADSNRADELIGAIGGLLVALVIATLIYILHKSINLRILFTVVGTTLVIFASALVADLIENLQSLSVLPFLKTPLWNSSRILNEDSSLGDIFHSFLGYSDHPTVLQLSIQFIFIIVVFYFFFKASPKQRAQQVEKAATSLKVTSSHLGKDTASNN